MPNRTNLIAKLRDRLGFPLRQSPGRKPPGRGIRLRLETLDARRMLASDILYIGDAHSDSVQKFDADTGANLGSFVATGSAGLHGPRGLVFDRGNLLVVNQNVGLPLNGEVLRFNGQTGAAAGALVPSADANAPFSPAGIVVRDNVAYVADTRDDSSAGRIRKYDATTGSFLGDLVPAGFEGEFRPRGMAFGPDGGLYVTVFSEALFDSFNPPGYILRFDTTTGEDRVVAWNNGDDQGQAGEAGNLHNPEGIAFGPDGRIYVTSNRNDIFNPLIDDNTYILVIDPASGSQLDGGPYLDSHSTPADPTRIAAQAILFGPQGKLYIPITETWLNDGFTAGGVWTFDPSTQELSSLISPTRAESVITAPYYLTFGATDPATLDYRSDAPPALSGSDATPVLIDGPLTTGQYYQANVGIRSLSDFDGAVHGATVRISENYQSDQDSLTFQGSGAITGHWDAATGALTLQGRDSVGNYQAVLGSIAYVNRSRTPNLAKRTVRFVVHDDPADSNIVTRDIFLVKDDLNALFFTSKFSSNGNPNDLLLRLDPSTGESRLLSLFGVPGHHEGGLLVADQTSLLAAGRNTAIVPPPSGEGPPSGTVARGTVLRFPGELDAANSGTVVIADGSDHSPVDPEGMVLDGNTLYVADTRSGQPAQVGDSIPSGRIRRYNGTTGEWLNDVTANGYDGLFHPRGLVFGPDGSLYVSLYDPNTDAAGTLVRPGYGAILKIDSNQPAPVVVAFNNGDGVLDAGETPNLHSPGSLVFGPDGRMYVTTGASTPTELDKIVVLGPTTGESFTEVDHIDIARLGELPLHPLALVFGPGGKLFVSANEPDAPDPFSSNRGVIRSYDVQSKAFSVAYPPDNSDSGPIGYLTFGYSNPATLAFEPPSGAAPVLSGVEAAEAHYAANSAAAAVTATLAVADSDSANLVGAKVAIAANYQSDHDLLTFQNTANITGFWDSFSATLQLVGNDTLENYQSALRTVGFQSTDFVPLNGPARSPLPLARTIRFSVDDGEHVGNVAIRDVKVSVPRGDYLYIGDQGDPANAADDTVKQFDIQTGKLLSTFVPPGSLVGPRGLIFQAGDLLAVNQNVDTPFNGEVLRFDGQSGAPLSPIVSANHSQAPFAPRGIVVQDDVLYVADFEGAGSPRIAKYSATTGFFLGDLIPDGFSAEFRPRGLVFGPDGKLYVSVFSQALFDSEDPAGYVLRFLDTTTGAFEVVAFNNGDGVPQRDETTDLHKPEGLVFGPDGRLYVASSRANSADTDKILILDVTAPSPPNASSSDRLNGPEGECPRSCPPPFWDTIPLDQVGQPRAYAQALLFGPEGNLFVPITGDGPETGSVRRYNVATKGYDLLTIPANIGGPLQTPWYLTFTQTNPATLAYEPWHNFANSLDVDGSGVVIPLDALLIINEINLPIVSDSHGKLPSSRAASNNYYDVDGDGFAVPRDILVVINFLNRPATTQSEGELPTLVPQPPHVAATDHYFAAVAGLERVPEKLTNKSRESIQDSAAVTPTAETQRRKVGW